MFRQIGIALADRTQRATFGYSAFLWPFAVPKCCKLDSFATPPHCLRESGRPVQFLILPQNAMPIIHRKCRKYEKIPI